VSTRPHLADTSGGLALIYSDLFISFVVPRSASAWQLEKRVYFFKTGEARWLWLSSPFAMTSLRQVMSAATNAATGWVASVRR
jgi:hypothetical protein